LNGFVVLFIMQMFPQGNQRLILSYFLKCIWRPICIESSHFSVYFYPQPSFTTVWRIPTLCHVPCPRHPCDSYLHRGLFLHRRTKRSVKSFEFDAALFHLNVSYMKPHCL
jgi:hypothetical protein